VHSKKNPTNHEYSLTIFPQQKKPNPNHKLNQEKATTTTINPKATMSTTNNMITAAILQ